jgi:hypothetical protein
MKKMKNVIFKSLMVIGFISFLTTGCRKNEDLDSDTSTASDNALAEATFTDVNNIADEGASGSLNSYKGGSADGILSTCATISFNVTGNDTSMTIDFGPVNCLCRDNRYRRGQIVVTWTGAYKDSGHVHTITFNNYFVNDNQVMGLKTITNNGPNNAGNLSYTVDVNGSIILSQANGGATITWVSQRIREFIQGASTPAWNDDVYLITGSATGSSSTGKSFTATITSPVRKELGCYYLVSGTVEFNPSGKATRTIDFGSGACDNDATVTIKGHVHHITLR